MRPQLKRPGLRQRHGEPHPLRPGEIPLRNVEIAVFAPAFAPGVPAPDAAHPVFHAVPGRPDHVTAQPLLHLRAGDGRLSEHRAFRRDLLDPGKELQPQLHELPLIQRPPHLVKAPQRPVVPDGQLQGSRQHPVCYLLEPLHGCRHLLFIGVFLPAEPAVLLRRF